MAKERETILKENLKAFGHIGENMPKLKESDLDSSQFKEIQKIYKELGGILNEAPINYGKYDIIFNDFVVELDEENHFNRYRKQTLNSKIYSNHSGFELNKYKYYCSEDNESKCRADGGYWTNPSTENQFGIASSKRDFSNNGSPRWKQRAYYDYLKDHLVYVLKIPVIRLSIYDEIEGMTVDKILTTNSKRHFPLIVKKINISAK